MSGVTCEVSVDLRELRRRLLDDEVAILEAHADQNVADIQEAWQGWKYKRIPKDYEPGLSRAKWRRARSQTTEGVREVEIINDADHGDGAYAGYVHRARTPKEDLEATKMIQLVQDSLPDLVEKMQEAVQRNADAPVAPKKLKRGAAGSRPAAPRKTSGPLSL